MPWLQEGGQVRLVGSASMDGFVSHIHTVDVMFTDIYIYVYIYISVI